MTILNLDASPDISLSNVTVKLSYSEIRDLMNLCYKGLKDLSKEDRDKYEKIYSSLELCWTLLRRDNILTLFRRYYNFGYEAGVESIKNDQEEEDSKNEG